MVSADQTLVAFVREALDHGRSRTEIADALRGAGWAPGQIVNAIDAFATVDFPVPVPRPKAYVSARDFFLYLLQFTVLYVSAIYLGLLLFQLVYVAFPDAAALGGHRPSESKIRWAIACLIIFFPTFVLLTRYLDRDVADTPAHRRSAMRRWLGYLTLYATASIVLGDLAFLIYEVLSGSLTVPFTLKALVVALIAGAIFVRYQRDLRRSGEDQ